MSIVVVGCNHTSAPLALLERLAIPAGELGTVLSGLRESVREVFVLSTCNRTEFYAVTGHATSGRDLLTRALSARAGDDPSILQHAYAHTDADAVAHALRVASGLDSMVLGEDQIQAQWKRALAHARLAESLGPVLDRLGSAALACGKRVRTFTGVGRHSVSLESLAVRRVADRLGEQRFAGRHVLLIGAGESAGLVARHLAQHGAPRVTVMSRSYDTAERFAAETGGSALPIEQIADVVPQVDAIFCCTAAPHPVLGHAHFERWPTREPGRPLVCVDLGMPRDIEERVAEVGGVEVIGLAQLAAQIAQHRAERAAELPAAEAIVLAERDRFLEWQASRGSAAAVARLHAHARGIAEIELDVALARLPHLPARDREIIANLAHRIVNKLLHTPTVALKGHPEADNIALALEWAFGLRSADALDTSLPHEAADSADAEPRQDIA